MGHSVNLKERLAKYDPKEWSEEDIALHKSIDWSARNYEDYEVADDTFIDTAKKYNYGGAPEEKKVVFHKFLRANPIYPPYYAPARNPFDGGIGPMYDGHVHGLYGVHDRYEDVETYTRLSEAIQGKKRMTSLKESIDEDKIVYYVFPELNEEDIKEARAYGLKELKGYGEADETVLSGKYGDLTYYAARYLGYELVNGYLFDENGNTINVKHWFVIYYDRWDRINREIIDEVSEKTEDEIRDDFEKSGYDVIEIHDVTGMDADSYISLLHNTPGFNESLKEGAEGKRDPNWEYVIIDVTDDEQAPVVGKRSTKVEADYAQIKGLNKKKFENRDLVVHKVPKGMFKIGDTYDTVHWDDEYFEESLSEDVNMKESILRESRWEYEVDKNLALSLREAIKDDDALATCSFMQLIYDDIYEKINDEDIFTEDELERYKEDIDLIDLDAKDADEAVNYELDNLYDFCDSLNIWIPIN